MMPIQAELCWVDSTVNKWNIVYIIDLFSWNTEIHCNNALYLHLRNRLFMTGDKNKRIILNNVNFLEFFKHFQKLDDSASWCKDELILFLIGWD